MWKFQAPKPRQSPSQPVEPASHAPGPLVAVLGDYDHFLQGMLRKALDAAGIRYTAGADERSAIAVVWNPWSRVDPLSLVPAGLAVPTVNATGFHCSKLNVSRHFEKVFGYALSVDPLSFHGLMVRKADANAAHDGVTLVGPLEGEAVVAGQVYQRLVDNTFGPSVVDVRVSVVRTVRAGCYVKLRTVEDRYSNDNTAAWFAPTHVLLTQTEIRLLDEFCESIGLEFGQLDLCRDNTSGRIYVVDANNTPFGPSNGMSEADASAALRALGEDFSATFGLEAISSAR